MESIKSPVTKDITEIMDILQEECAEVIQAISKIRRFGIDTIGPYSKNTNREELEIELGDLTEMIVLLAEKGLIDMNAVVDHSYAKRQKLKTWSKISID